MGLFSSLSREQKEVIGLLQVGTFLEYFDLMLYVHMAVLLNEIFFPQTDSKTAAILAAFTFCSTYIMRPVGALIFGWLGDNIGRKSTIIIATLMMSLSCVAMANLPTYAQVGISATWIMTLCRMAQGVSSMGEIIGAQIYVTETIPRPKSYPAVALITTAASVGATVALGIATIVTSYHMNWRLAFWIGAIIAFVGALARTRLRETPDFLKMKRQQMRRTITLMKQKGAPKNATRRPVKNAPIKNTPVKGAPIWDESVKTKTLLSYFFIHCGYPLSFYLTYIYFNPMLKEDFGYAAEDIIRHNFLLSIIMVIASLFLAYLSCRVHPIRILKIRWVFTFLLMIMMPVCILNLTSAHQLFFLQSLILLLNLSGLPADAVFYYHMPIYRRFTFASFLYALSRVSMYVITSFGLVYFGSYFGNFGLWFLTLPITAAYIYGVLHFEGLERKLGIYTNVTIPQKPLLRRLSTS